MIARSVCLTIVVMLTFWAITGCIPITKNSTFTPAMKIEKSITPRSKPALLVKKNDKETVSSDKGYFLLGTVTYRQKTKKCWYEEGCKIYSSSKTIEKMLLDKAAKEGGDAVILTNERQYTESISKNGKCLKMGQGTISEWVCDTEAYTNALGNYDTRKVNCRTEEVSGITCIERETILGDIHYSELTGKVYRYDPEMALKAKQLEDFKLALMEGSSEEVQAFIDNGQVFKEKLIDGTKPIELAISSDNPQAVEALIRNGVPISNDWLRWAISLKSFKVADALIEAGADVNAISVHKVPPLLAACLSGNLELTKKLIKRGADITAIDGKGRCCFQYAADGDSIEIIDLLIASGADKNCGKSTIASAVFPGNEELVKDLIERGFDVNKLDRHGETPLAKAVWLHNFRRDWDTSELQSILKKNGAKLK